MNRTRLKILHVVLSLEPGGLENGIINVAQRLDPDEFEVHVCCLEKGGAFVERLPEPKKVSVLHKRPGLSPKLVLDLIKLLGRINPHVVHSHGLAPLIYSAMAMSFGFRRPLVHGEHVITMAQRTEKSMRQRRLFYPLCKNIHAVSHSLRYELIDLGMPEEKISVILNGVDSKRFTPSLASVARKKINLPETGIVFGIVGRLDRHKRHLELIDAFDQVAVKFPTTRLLIVGGGGDNQDEVLARVRSSAFAERIHLAGFQARPEEFYRAMDLLISPSLCEGLSNVILEAMACGVPVLAHTATGNSELILHGENGVLMDLVSTADLKLALETLVDTVQCLPKMGHAARDHVLKNFSMEKMVENYARLYREVAETQPNPDSETVNSEKFHPEFSIKK